MPGEIVKKDVKIQIRQLEALILLMAGTTLASLQIVHYIFISSGAVNAFQILLDWYSHVCYFPACSFQLP